MSKIINIQNNEGQLVVTSREIAENFVKEHSKVLRSIETTMLNEPSQNWIGYFIPSEYADAKGEMRKEYLLTKDGFSLLVMGFTGAKALRWKMKYIEAFNNMEKILKDTTEVNIKVVSLLHAEVGGLIETSSKIEGRVGTLENTMTIDYRQQLELSEIAKTVAISAMGNKDKPAYKDSSVRSKVFSQVWKDYKDYFEINSYKNTTRVQFERAKEYLRNWKAQGKTLREIENLNGNMAL